MSPEPPIEPEHWVERHGDSLYGFALLRLRNAEAAAEAVQETFLAALRTRGGFSGLASERTWLIAILKHKIIDHIRRSSRREAASGQEENGGLDEFFDAHGHWKIGPGRTEGEAKTALDREEFWLALRKALGELPSIYADTFTLTELEGLPGPEVCEILGISATNLASRLHRARLMLRKALGARGFGLGDG